MDEHAPSENRKCSGSTVILDGTTIDEVERVHRDTLQLVVDETNRRYREWLETQEALAAREAARREAHRRKVEDTARRITFDE